MRPIRKMRRPFGYYLQQQPHVTKIYHPSLPEHPGHDIAKRQQQGFGAMLSFEVDFDIEQLKQFLKVVCSCFVWQSHWVEWRIWWRPASMTHAGMDPEARRVAGISDQLLRFPSELNISLICWRIESRVCLLPANKIVIPIRCHSPY